MDYMSTDFGADSSSRFSFRARTNKQTNKQTRLNALPHKGGYTASMGNCLITSGQRFLTKGRIACHVIIEDCIIPDAVCRY